MRHRHLDVAEELDSIATIASILERGGATDIWRLLERIEADPDGPTARAAVEAALRTKVYGYRVLIPALVEWARARPARS